MKMNFRIKKYPKGWIVEYERIYFFGFKKKWEHITHYAGLPDKTFYYKTAEKARDGALDAIRDKINYSFYFPVG